MFLRTKTDDLISVVLRSAIGSVGIVVMMSHCLIDIVHYLWWLSKLGNIKRKTIRLFSLNYRQRNYNPFIATQVLWPCLRRNIRNLGFLSNIFIDCVSRNSEIPCLRNIGLGLVLSPMGFIDTFKESVRHQRWLRLVHHFDMVEWLEFLFSFHRRWNLSWTTNRISVCLGCFVWIWMTAAICKDRSSLLGTTSRRVFWTGMFSWSSAHSMMIGRLIGYGDSTLAVGQSISLLVVGYFDEEVEILLGSVIDCDVVRKEVFGPFEFLIDAVDGLLHLLNGHFVGVGVGCHPISQIERRNKNYFDCHSKWLMIDAK